MPSDTMRQVRGIFRIPSGEVAKNKTLTVFRQRRAVSAAGSSTVVDEPFFITTDAAGLLDAWMLSGNYVALVKLSDADRYFNMAVPDAVGPHNPADILDAGPVDDSILTQVQQLVLLARGWAENPVDVEVDPDNYPGEYSSKHYAALGAASAAEAAQEAAKINTIQRFVLSIGASAIAGKNGATGGSLDVFDGVNIWNSDSTGANYVAGTSFSQATFGTAPLNWGGGLANSTPLQVMNALKQSSSGDIYGAFLAMGGHATEALITDATLAANSWTRDPSDENLTLHYANIQSAIDAMPGSKTVADYLVYYQHNNSGTGRDYYQPRVKAILDDLVTAGLIDDTTRIVLVEASQERTDEIIESVQISLSDIASRDYPNAVTVGQGGIPTFDEIHPSGIGCVWLGQRIAQALLGGGISASQRMILLDRSNNDLASFAEWYKWNGDNMLLQLTNDTGSFGANWNVQQQAFRVTGNVGFGAVDYMRVEQTGIEDTAIGAATANTGGFTELTASGNIVMGTTLPWVFAAAWRGIKITDRHGLQATPTNNVIALSSNSAIGPSGWEYTFDADAGKYTISGNLHIWNQAASGTDGNSVSWTEAMRLDGSGLLHIGHDGSVNSPGVGNTTEGTTIGPGGHLRISRPGGPAIRANRNDDDGKLITFQRDGTEVGDISVLAGTVSLNGAHLTRISQGHIAKDTRRGTVMSNTDEMCAWGYLEYTVPVLLEEAVEAVDYKAATPEVQNIFGRVVRSARPEEPAIEAKDAVWGDAVMRAPYFGGLPDGAKVEVEYEGHVYTAVVRWEVNEQLNKLRVSDIEADRNVAGVFETFDLDDPDYPEDFKIAQSGDYVILVGKGVKVKRGDLMESAGNGTAKVQEGDLVRSSTIAKITSTVVADVYEDGSYIIPCVLMVC